MTTNNIVNINQSDIDPFHQRRVRKLTELLICLFWMNPQKSDLVLSLGSYKARNNKEAIHEWVSQTMVLLGPMEIKYLELELVNHFCWKLQEIADGQRESFC